MVDTDSDDKTDLLDRATKRYKKAKDAWHDVYERAREDLWFLSDEPYAQWDQEIANDRVTIGRPTLQIDQLGQFIHQVTNDIRMNTPTINVIPDGDGADIETAEIFEGIIKGIEYNSSADAAYDTSTDFSVKSSIGFLRVDHGYSAATGFEQELLIKRVINPQSILIDPDSIEPDGSDAKWGFVLEDLSKSEFEELYGDAAQVSFGDENPSKAKKDIDKITVAEYFYINEETKQIGQKNDGTIEEVQKGSNYKAKRSIQRRTVMRCKVSGAAVLEETTFPGIYIPLVPVYGEEAWVEGKRKLYSLIRKSKSAQMMYNLWKSLETELLLKQQQAPVQAAVGQMEGFEDDWKNPEKAMVLYYKQTDVDGNPAPAPQRLQPPTIPTGIVNAANETINDIKATMGIYNAGLGEKSNAISGVAYNAQKKEGDVATYHFGDNLNRSIAHLGKILVFAIPEIYDTPRVLKIIDEEDEIKMIAVNGAPLQAGQNRPYDLTSGKFNVRVITGPAFTTQRQEAAATYQQLLTADPQLMPVIGDLAFKYSDMPGSQAIAARLRKLIDPKLLDDNSSPEMAQIKQLQAQLQQVTQAAQAEIQQLNAKLQDKTVDNQVKVAETQIKQEDVNVKKGELQLKYLQAAKEAPGDKTSIQLPSNDNPASVDDPIEVLQAKIAHKIRAQQIDQANQLTQAQQDEEDRQQQQALEQAKLQQTNSALQILQNIQQGIGALVQVTAESAQSTQALTQAVSQPITIVRDEQGNMIGAQ